MLKPYYSDDLVSIYHGDAREIAPVVCPPQPNVLLVADPPYGARYDTTKARGTMYAKRDWVRLSGEHAPFDPTWLLSYPRVVIFGASQEVLGLDAA